MLVIGETINAAVPAVARALEARDGAFFRRLAEEQAQAGADCLDLCAAVRRGEREALRWVIETVQEAVELPLCLDSADAALLTEAMAWCARPGILNSFSMEADKAERVLPAVAGTGWQAVGLLCDQRIPQTAQQRLAVLDRILELAQRYGVETGQLLLDPMMEMVCTAERGALTALETIRAAKQRGLRTVAAVSNVSYHMPVRRGLHQALLPLAMAAGLDAAILDPRDRELAAVRYAAAALLGQDFCCQDYMEAYRRDLFGPKEKRRG